MFFFFLRIRAPPRSTLDRSSAASDVYKRQARGIGVEVEGDEPVLVDALLQLGDAGLRIDPGRLRQHRRADEVVGEQPAHPVAELVADRRPGRAGLEAVSYTHLRAHETVLDLVCRLLLAKKNTVTST